jgi:hypothetical protein
MQESKEKRNPSLPWPLFNKMITEFVWRSAAGSPKRILFFQETILNE